jgi:endonuclease/exonuclease/phosphatase family metal-dependent hydrolase
MAYNIQQGYSVHGLRNFDAQIEVIRRVDPDILGIQETDTNRIVGGNNDLVRYFADKLNMYSYYGPTPVTGTFGVALLSKYPLKNPRTYFLYSHAPGIHEKEQIAAAEATITVGPKTFTVAVTHLGNSGPAVQMQAILDAVREKNDVIVMGDLNSEPGGHAYSTAGAVMDDSWIVAGGGRVDGREVPNKKRIDHIFVSRGTRVTHSHYILGPQSDHPAMVTGIAWE